MLMMVLMSKTIAAAIDDVNMGGRNADAPLACFWLRCMLVVH